MPDVYRLSSLEDQTDPMYCLYYIRKGHVLEQCATFRKIFGEKHMSGEGLSRKTGCLVLKNYHFPVTEAI